MQNRRVLALAAATLVGVATVGSAVELNFDAKIDAKEILAQIGQEASQNPAPAVAPAEIDMKSAARRIVVFNKGISVSRQMSVVQAAGGIVLKKLWLIDALAILAPNQKTQKLDSVLAATPDVKRVEEDYYQNWLQNGETPEPEGQKLPWGVERVNAKGAWAVTRGAGVKVAVVDTGVDFDHPDLKLAGGFNVITHDKNYKDDNGHGSHVAGTIAAQDNGEGVVGVAPEVSLYGVKVLDANGSGTFADVVEGIQWTVENKMDVANFSLGASQGTQALEDAVNAAAKGGVAVIAAAGNSGGSVGYPAAYSSVIAISASSNKDKLAYFSSRGPEVDFIAPGVNVDSTYMGGGYSSLSGTSMACPHAAGLAALAAATGAHGKSAIEAALKKAAAPLSGLKPEEQGAGMIDAAKIVGR
ncbi:MAG: S8 family peptidase [Elusimicrobiota bacterium]